MRALGNYVVVCRRSIPQDVKSKGGIILVNKDRDEDYYEAVVVSVGNDFEEMKLNAGDWVLVENTDNRFKIGTAKAGEILAISGYDIICVLEDEDEID